MGFMKEANISFILFGGTGDLARKKLVPAFANLINRGIIGKESSIIGISRKKLSDEEYKKFLLEGVAKNEEKEHIKKLRIRYFSGDFTRKEGLEGLKELIDKTESDECHRIYYLSTSFSFFPNIVMELKKDGLDKNKNGSTKIVFEKPFGKDLRTSEELNKEIYKAFKEEQVYRIDHYLAKDTVQNLNVLKFTNPLIYSSFGNLNIDKIEVDIEENTDVENRIEYYNESGALKDMIQNHLLQVLSLLLMERPKPFTPDGIHNAKINVLKNLEVLDAKEHLLGQYKSYENQIKRKGLEDKRTETFAKIRLNCKMKRWKGVPLTLRTGKKLKRKHGEIRIYYKPAAGKFVSGFSGFKDNKIVIGIYPKQDVTIFMNSRTPEQNNEVKPVKFEFCQECEFGPNTTDEYSILMEEIIKGDKTLFSRNDEVSECWRIVDKIEKMKNKIKFVKYEDGTDPDFAKQ